MTEADWEALIELDRIEYNNEHAYVRHKSDALNEDEDSLQPDAQEKQIDRDVPFLLIANAKIDRARICKQLTPKEQEIVCWCFKRTSLKNGGKIPNNVSKMGIA